MENECGYIGGYFNGINTNTVFQEYMKKYGKYTYTTESCVSTVTSSVDQQLKKMKARIEELQEKNSSLQKRILQFQSGYNEYLCLVDIFFLLRQQVYFEKFFSFVTEKIMIKNLQQKYIIQKVFLNDSTRMYSFLQKQYELSINQLRELFVVLEVKSSEILDFLKNDDI